MAEQPEDLVAALEADLVALAAAEADLERDAEVAERTRIERTAVTLRDRLRGCHGPVEIAMRGGSRHSGRVADVGADWVLLQHVPVGQRAVSAEHLVLIPAVVTVRGLGRTAVAGSGPLAERVVGSVVRGWCRDRSEVSVALVDGTVVAGLASAMFADHLELSTGGGATVVVPVGAIAVLSR
jgi:molybdopterin-binding protein